MAYTPAAARYLDMIASNVRGRSPLGQVERIEALVADHDAWRGACLNMNPAEAALSARAQAVLASGLATRLTEGLPGDKAFPHYRLNAHIDEIEATIIALARHQFGARFVEWRPTSTSMANAAVFFATLQPGDAILVQDEDSGGNYSYQASGAAGLAGARVVTIPPSGELFEIDPEAVAALAERVRPKVIVIGGGKVLFPYPLAALRVVADRVGALLVYDAAHLGLLISAGEFQRPLQDGAHVVTVSTHKSMGGPVGGLILTNDEGVAARLLPVIFPGLLQTRDLNKYAALAITLAELEAFGANLARKMTANARTLGAALAVEGFEVLGDARGPSATHQLFLRLGEDAQDFERLCQAANIIIPDCALTGDGAHRRRSGARIGVHEVTRQGMGPAQMRQIAHLVRRAVEGEPGVKAEVEALASAHAAIPGSFDGVLPPRPATGGAPR